MKPLNFHAQGTVWKEVGTAFVLDSKEASSEVNEWEAATIGIRTAAENAIGRLSLNDATKQFRNAPFDLALARAKGSRRAAAKLLGVT